MGAAPEVHRKAFNSNMVLGQALADADVKELYVSILFLAITTLFGLPISRVLPLSYFPNRRFAAPVLGFALVGVATAVAYRHELPLTTTIYLLILGSVALGLIELSLSKQSLVPMRQTLIAWAGGAGVLLLCIAPAWTGGARFAAFQGNQYDQLNYMTQASAYRASQHYGALKSYTGPQPILRLGKNV